MVSVVERDGGGGVVTDQTTSPGDQSPCAMSSPLYRVRELTICLSAHAAGALSDLSEAVCLSFSPCESVWEPRGCN